MDINETTIPVEETTEVVELTAEELAAQTKPASDADTTDTAPETTEEVADTEAAAE